MVWVSLYETTARGRIAAITRGAVDRSKPTTTESDYGFNIKDHPRPKQPYYEVRHEYLTQGDILRDLPFAQLGPSIIVVDSPPEGEPIPEGTLPVLSYVAYSPFGIVLSDTCDFRHPPADAISIEPKDYFHKRKSIYHSGYVRVAPIFPLDYWRDLPEHGEALDEFKTLDNYRKLMYLPAHDGDLPAAAIGFHMADSIHIDLLLTLERVTQLTRVARQQLNFKIVWFDTGFGVPRDDFNPDLT